MCLSPMAKHLKIKCMQYTALANTALQQPSKIPIDYHVNSGFLATVNALCALTCSEIQGIFGLLRVTIVSRGQVAWISG